METDELIRHVKQVATGVWRHRWTGLAVGALVGVLGMVAVSLIKDRYEAGARVYVDTQSVLKPLMAGLAFQPDIDQQVRMLARTLISRPNVERLMDSPDIGLAPEDATDRERMVIRLMEKIKVAPSGSGNLYNISYRDTDPERARRLVERLVQLFVDSSVGTKSRDSAEASRFIDQQIAEYEKKLVDAENRLKEFKIRHFGVSGVSNQDYFARMSELADQVTRLRVELSAAEHSRNALRRELSAEDPQLPPGAVPLSGMPVQSEVDARLEAQNRQLDDLLRRYTDEHPDVVSTRRTIAQLEAQKRQEALSKDGKGRSAPTNPVFQRIRMSLAEAEANVASLRTRLAAEQARLDQVRALASRVPQVEAELAQLNRDYDIIRKNYEQLVARREAASLGVKIDQTSQLADFRLVEPASVSPLPVFPSRKILALLVIVASAGAGVAAAFFRWKSNPPIDAERALNAITGRPVLGSISLIMSNSMRLQQRKENLAFASASMGFGLVCVAWLAWIVIQGRL